MTAAAQVGFRRIILRTVVTDHHQLKAEPHKEGVFTDGQLVKVDEDEY